MSRGKVIYTEHMVDMRTGELVSSKSVYVNRSNEKFWMFRVTDDPYWVFSLGGNELKVLLCMQNYADADNRIFLDATRRKFICDGMGIKGRMLSRILAVLVEKDFLARTGVNSYMSNPNFVYRCPVKLLREKVDAYNAEKS